MWYLIVSTPVFLPSSLKNRRECNDMTHVYKIMNGIYIYLRNKETQQTKIIFFACLNDGLVKSLLKISY